MTVRNKRVTHTLMARDRARKRNLTLQMMVTHETISKTHGPQTVSEDKTPRQVPGEAPPQGKRTSSPTGSQLPSARGRCSRHRVFMISTHQSPGTPWRKRRLGPEKFTPNLEKTKQRKDNFSDFIAHTASDEKRFHCILNDLN
jgi:hypothetical protein